MVLFTRMTEGDIFAAADIRIRSDKSARRMTRHLARQILLRSAIYLQSANDTRKLQGFSSGNSRAQALLDDLDYPGAKPNDTIYQRTYRDKNRDAINAGRRKARASRRAAGIKQPRTLAQKAAQDSYNYDPITGGISEARKKCNKRYYEKHKTKILAKRKADYEAQIESETTGRKKRAKPMPVAGDAAIAQRIDAEVAEFKRKTRAKTKRDIVNALREERDDRAVRGGTNGIAD